MRYRLFNIAEMSGGMIHPRSNENMLLETVNSDSRKIVDEKNVLFAALKGDKVDGHKFVESVTASGANAAIIDDEKYFAKNTVLVSSVKKALYDIALKYRYNEIKDVKTAAVTGSVGKTTTKEMIHLAMSATFNAFKSPGNINSLTGMPMAVLNTAPSYEWAVMELGMNQRFEIRKLSLLVRPDTAVITNIGWPHIEALGSLENIREEKLDITEGMNYNGTLLLNGDDPLLNRADTRGRKTMFYSLNDDNSDFKAYDITETEDGIRFFVRFDGGNEMIYLPMKGIHVVSDAMAAFSAAVISGADPKNSAAALSDITKESNRQKKENVNGITIISDCYNASPQSMKAALETVEETKCSGKRIAVLGDMLELGEYSEKLHRLVGEYVSLSGIDRLVCVGKEAGFIADEAKKRAFGEDRISVFGKDGYDDAASFLNDLSNDGDVILFKASNRMDLGKIAARLKEMKNA